MDSLPNWANLAIGIGGLLGSVATAIATIFLWRVTKTLARETTRMAEAAAQPHVVATLTPNQWSMRHFDLQVENTGNATAYDIEVSFDPPLENGEARQRIGIPLQRISVLKPGHRLSSYLTDYTLIKGKAYRVQISWRKDILRSERQYNGYTLNMADHDDISRLGDDPTVEIAKHFKKLEENLAPVLRAQKRIEVNVYATSDRLHERRLTQRQYRAWQRQNQPISTESTIPETAQSPERPI